MIGHQLECVILLDSANFYYPTPDPRHLSVAAPSLPVAPPAPKRTWLWPMAGTGAAVVLAGGVLAAGAMFLSMLPILDTEGLIEVAALHRYAGLAVVIAALFHVLALLSTRLRWR